RVLDSDPRGRARALVRQGALRARRDRTLDALECYRAATALLPEGGDGSVDRAGDQALADEADAARAGLGRCAYLLGRPGAARAAWEPLHARGVAPRAPRAIRLGEI